MNEIIIPNEDGNGETSIRLSDQLPIDYFSPFVDSSDIVIGNVRKNPKGAYNISENILLGKEAQKALRLPHILSKRNRQWTINNAKLRSNGRFIDTGSIELLKQKRNFNTGGVFADFSILFNESSFTDAIGEKTLRDLTMGGDIIIPKNPDGESLYPFEDYATAVSYTLLWDGDDNWFNKPYTDKSIQSTNWWAKEVVLNGHDLVCFPTFRGKRGDDDFVICNWWDDTNQKFYDYSNNQMISGTFTPAHNSFADRVSYRNPIVPWYYYHKVIRHCFSEFGYILKSDWLLDHPYFMRMVLPNNYSIIKETVVVIDGITSGVQPLASVPRDAVNSLIIQEDTVISAKNHLSDMTIKEFLQDFCLNFGCRFLINGDRTVVIEHIELDKTQERFFSYGPETLINNTRFKGFEFKYDLSVDESLIAEDEFIAKPTLIVETLSKPFIPPLSSTQFGLDQNFNTIENINLNPYINNIIPYVLDDGEKSYKISIPPVHCDMVHYPLFSLIDPSNHQYSDADIGHDSWLPCIDTLILENEQDFYTYSINGLDTGNIPYPYTFYSVGDLVPGEKAQGVAVNLKAIYHGTILPNTLLPIIYPYASNHNYKPGDTSELGFFHLGLHGEKGIVNTFIKDMLLVWEAKEYHTFYLKMTWDDIRSFKWNQAIIIRGVRYYIGKLKFNTPITGLVEADCYPLIYKYV